MILLDWLGLIDRAERMAFDAAIASTENLRATRGRKIVPIEKDLDGSPL
jgi:hypothetical protein